MKHLYSQSDLLKNEYETYIKDIKNLENSINNKIKLEFQKIIQPLIDFSEEIDYILTLRFGDEGLDYGIRFLISENTTTNILYIHSNNRSAIRSEFPIISTIISNQFSQKLKIEDRMNWITNYEKVVVNIHISFNDGDDDRFGDGWSFKNISLFEKELNSRFEFLKFAYTIYDHKTRGQILTPNDNSRVNHMSVMFLIGDLN